ncbi:MAG: LuxR family transcriptional regulator [Pseudomonadota bacterium]
MKIYIEKFIETSLAAKDLEALFHDFESAIQALGYKHCVFFVFPPKKHSGETVPVCPYFNIATEIIQTYTEKKLYKTGPVFEKSRITGRPVVWSDLLSDERYFEKLPELKKFFELLSAHGYKNGFTVPIFGPSSSFGYISFTSDSPRIDEDSIEIAHLRHICFSTFYDYLRIVKDHEQTPETLTQREKEVLLWVLRGKSNSVIAEIMELSEHTVSTYIKRSAEKLNASGKWSTALSAVLTGIVQY